MWEALGDVDHYVEPFAGSLAVLLGRPHEANRAYYTESVNDADGLLVNAWRSIQLSPDATAEACSWPVSELDQSARHVALVRWREECSRQLLAGSPEWHDPKMAGWWLWGVACWIGGGWCDGLGPWTINADGRLYKQPPQRSGRAAGVDSRRPHLSDNGRGVNAPQLREPGVSSQLPNLSDGGRGVNHAGLREPGVSSRLPHLSNDGMGVNAPQLREPGVSSQLPHLSDNGMGVNHAGLRERDIATEEFVPHDMTMPKLRTWFRLLAARLRHVRIISGDWSRLVTNGATKTLTVRQGGVCGVFCLHPETPVRMADETMKPVSDVRAGDRVFGGRTVLSSWSRNHTGTLLRLKVQGVLDDLRLTGEHRVLSVRGRPIGARQDVRTGEEQWAARRIVRADQLAAGDMVCIPSGGLEIPVRFSIPDVAFGVKAKIQNPVTFNADHPGLWRLLGLYAAEGCIASRRADGSPKTVSFTFSHDEAETLVKETVGLVWAVFGVRAKTHGPTNGSISVRVGSVEVAHLFASLVPGLQPARQLANCLMTAPLEQQRVLLRAWLDGDGHCGVGDRNRTKLCGTSASVVMATQMAQIGYRLGLRPSMKRRAANVDVYFATADARAIGYDVPSVRADCSTRRIGGGHVMARIKSVSVEAYDGPVFDIDVDGDDLFPAPWAMVHNCDPPYADTAERSDNLYGVDCLSVAHKVREWCLAHGDDPQYRIVLAGFEGEHGTSLADAGWREVEWFTKGFLSGGMANLKGRDDGDEEDLHQQKRERLWLSPHCLKPKALPAQRSLFGEDD